MILYTGGEDIPIRAYNSNKVYYNGSTWDTHSWGRITVLAQVDKYYVRPTGEKHYRFFIVEFEEGTKVVTEYSPIKNKQVKNPNIPSVYNKGCVGQGPHVGFINGINTKEYDTWYSMLQRCYSEQALLKRPSYRGCTVSKRWLNFQFFCADVQRLKNYKIWKTNKIPLAWQLDKDTKVKGNKIYSKETCVFITIQENIVDSAVTGLTYLATRLSDGHTEEFTNQSEFARKYKLQRRTVCACIHGEKASTGGWTFEIKKENK
jgi:hypothetical protein